MEEDLKQYTLVRDSLEIFGVSAFLEKMSAKLRNRIASFVSGGFNDAQTIHPSLPPSANSALVDFISDLPKVLHRVFDNSKEMLVLVSNVKLDFVLLVSNHGDRAKQQPLCY